MAQIGPAQIGPAQIRARVARPDQTHPRQVGTDLQLRAPPLVPSLHPLLEPRDVLPFRHERPPSLVNSSLPTAKLKGMMAGRSHMALVVGDGGCWGRRGWTLNADSALRPCHGRIRRL